MLTVVVAVSVVIVVAVVVVVVVVVFSLPQIVYLLTGFPRPDLVWFL
jgi:hypothetical protein